MKSKISVLPCLLASAFFIGVPLMAQQIQAMKLLTTRVGWAEVGDHLYWTTTEGKHWGEITPRKSAGEDVGGVFFLDTSHGWVLLAHEDAYGEQQFRVASTEDAGATWRSSEVDLPWKRYPQDLDAGGEVFFLDPSRGWLSLYTTHGLLPAGAHLLATEDGGKTWHPAKAEPGWAGRSFCFFNPADGVLAGGGTEGTELWFTHDGAKSWQKLVLKVPTGSSPRDADFPTYGDPVCADAKNGFLPVTFAGSEDGSVFVLFATKDGGRNWKSDRVVPNLPGVSPGERFASTVAESTLLLVKSRTKADLAVISRSGQASTLVRESKRFNIVFALSFADPSHGWASTGRGLMATADGGATWNEITPKPVIPSRCSRLMRSMTRVRLPGSTTASAIKMARWRSQLHLNVG